MILRARHVVPVSSPPIEDGAVVVEGNRISAVGTWEEIRGAHRGDVLDLGSQILLPGLVNAHCHLDYSLMRSAISPPRTFTQWIRRINAIKRSTYPQDYLGAISAGYRELQKWGTTTVANIETFPELIEQIEEPPVRTWWFMEMIDVRARNTAEEVLEKAMEFVERTRGLHGGVGLSPHAPYTASGDLFTLCSRLSESQGLLVTTHVAESREEWEMFRHGRGQLFDFMLQLGRWINDCQQERTPLGGVAACAALNRHWLLVHMNELSEEDFIFLESLPADNRPSIAHCPGSHNYFKHSPFPLPRLLEIGINVCLGTDSFASTLSLSLFDEMRAVAERQPHLLPAEILRMATTNGAAALGMADQLGKIAPGCFADLIALPCSSGVDDVNKVILEYRKPVPWRMLNGRVD